MAKREIPETDPNKLRNDFPGNSYAKRDREEKDISNSSEKASRTKQIAKGKVKKQSLLKKFTRYIVEDTIESAKERTFMDIVVPGIKTLIFDTGTEILDQLLFGGEGDLRSSRRRSEGRSKTSYSRYYDEKNRKSSKRESYREMANDPDDIIMDTRKEARNVLEELDRVIDRYGQASIADFYDIVGVTSDWTDSRYGWTRLDGAGIRSVRDGFLIILPRTEVLED